MEDFDIWKMRPNRYVLAFAFDPETGEVLLIEKQKPSWQAGLLNGVGGKIEKDEMPLEAMRREFREEAGVDIPFEEWSPLAHMASHDIWQKDSWEVFCYRVVTDLSKARQMESEVLFWCNPRDLPDNVIDNLRWLVPMASARVPAWASVTEHEEWQHPAPSDDSVDEEDE